MGYTDMDLDTALAQLTTMADAAGEDLDRMAARELLELEFDKIEQGVRRFEATNGRGSRCERWVSVTCVSEGGTMPLSHPVPEARAGRVLVGWGGSSCYQVGRCRICVHYKCEVLRVSP